MIEGSNEKIAFAGRRFVKNERPSFEDLAFLNLKENKSKKYSTSYSFCLTCLTKITSRSLPGYSGNHELCYQSIPLLSFENSEL